MASFKPIDPSDTVWLCRIVLVSSVPRPLNIQADDETKLSAVPGASVTMYVIGIELLKSDATQVVALGYCCDDSGAVPDAHVSYLAQRRERRGEWAVGVRMVLLLAC